MSGDGVVMLPSAMMVTATIVIAISLLNQLLGRLKRRFSGFPSAGKLDYRIISDLAQGVKKHPGQGVKFTAREYTFTLLCVAQYAN